jgi:hypothetical protein
MEVIKMGKCGEERPQDRKDEKNVKKETFKLKDLPEDMPVVMVAYPGCIEGDRVTYGTHGEDREVLAHGTAQQIAEYTVGMPVKVKVGKKEKEFKRNIGRKQEEAVQRIKDEMEGTGEVADLVKKKGGPHQGYTITVNNERVDLGSVLNSYFDVQTVKDTDKRYMGGVEMVISAVITPGEEKTLDKYLR